MATMPAMESGKGKPLYYYDPMVPNQHFDQPGKSPFMDMQLVPKFADDAGGSAPGFVLIHRPRKIWACAL
jgi:Cu(I)/Ag(I) efflux system membrane fusion protein